MREVRGETLRAAFDEQPALVARVAWLQRVCEAVAYAHSAGVVHRDLKPENVRLGEFDELTLLDWGLACEVGAARPPAGTRGYVAPEQRAGAVASTSMDVYALGAMLSELLTGAPPPAPGQVPPGPVELAEACGAATAAEPSARPTAAELGTRLRAWLEGEQRTEEARARLPAAMAHLHAAAAARAEAMQLRRAAADALRDVLPSAPIEAKRAGWDLGERAAEADRRADDAELDHQQALARILELDPGSAEARGLLDAHQRRQLLAAEARGDAREARRLTWLVEASGAAAASWLRAPATLTLRTEPPGLEVTIAPLGLVDRRSVPGTSRPLGRTPLVGVPVSPGGHLLTLTGRGREVHLVVDLARGEEWDPVRPGSVGPEALVVPEAVEGARWIPPGWFPAGGDAHAPDSLTARRVWVDGVHVATHRVTVSEYVAFLNDLPEAVALLHEPREDAGYGAAPRPVLRREGGRWVASAAAFEGGSWGPDWPVVLVDAHDAEAYAAWWSARTGRRWTLPHDLEWEKAARGVDGRAYPFGPFLDPAFANMVRSSAAEPGRVAVHAFPTDTSPYGIRGLAGNVRDLCANTWLRDGDTPDGAVVDPEAAPAPWPYRVVRGGSWMSTEPWCRSAARFANRPTARSTSFGFRLVTRDGRPEPTPSRDRAPVRGGSALRVTDGGGAPRPRRRPPPTIRSCWWRRCPPARPRPARSPPSRARSHRGRTRGAARCRRR